MSLRVRPARDAVDRDAIYRLRAALTRDGDGCLDGVALAVPPIGARVDRLIDRFDAFSSSRLVLAEDGERVIGALRVSRPAEVGIPIPGLDLGPHDAIVDRVDVPAPWRGRLGVVLNLLKAACRLSRDGGAPRAGALWVEAPSWLSGLLYTLGFEAAEAPRGDMTRWVAVRADLPDAFLEVGEPRLESLTEGFDREIFSKGEGIFRRGQAAGAVYLVARGSVRLEGTRPDGSTAILAVLGPGEMIGEEAVCEGGRRWLDAVAHAAETDLYVLDRRTLVARADAHAELRGELRRLLAERIHLLSSRLMGLAIEERPERITAILRDQVRQSMRLGEQAPLRLAGCTPEWLAAQTGQDIAEVRAALTTLGGCCHLEQGEVWVRDPEPLLREGPPEEPTPQPSAPEVDRPAHWA